MFKCIACNNIDGFREECLDCCESGWLSADALRAYLQRKRELRRKQAISKMIRERNSIPFNPDWL